VAGGLEVNFILLAAGRGQRMGGNKALMTFQNQAWILFQLRQIEEAGFDEVIIVTNEDAFAGLHAAATKSSQRHNIVVNPHPERGPLSSLKIALEENPEKASFLSPVDSPLKAPTLKVMKDAWRIDSNIEALVPSYNDHRGHPVILSVELQRKILQFAIDDPQARLDFILRSIPENKKRILTLEDPFIAMNLNSPEDLAALSRAT